MIDQDLRSLWFETEEYIDQQSAVEGKERKRLNRLEPIDIYGKRRSERHRE
jgi:hypothetical protein